MVDLAALAQMNLNLLLSLKALLDECNVSHAAVRLNITQPTMSRNLSQLRDYFQDPLIVRSGKKTILSAKAQELLPKVNEFVDSIYGMLATNFIPSKHCKEFIIAATDYVSEHILNDALVFLCSRYSKIDFTIVNWDPCSKQRLIDGDIHLAISIDDAFPCNMIRRVVDEDYLVCAMSRDHPLAGNKTLGLEEFLAYPHVSVTTGGGWGAKSIDRPLHAIGQRRTIKLKVPTYRLGFNAVKNTEFLVVVPEHVIRNNPESKLFKTFPLPFEAQLVRMSLWWHESHHRDCAHKWLREVLFPQLLNHPEHKGLSSAGLASGITAAPEAAGASAVQTDLIASGWPRAC
jgi:DNA-binding transcriptional LysR family regulator